MSFEETRHSVEQKNIERLKNAFYELKLAKNIGDDNSQDLINQIMIFVEMIHKWNQTYNLTALKNIPAILDQHIIDSLTVIPNLDGYFQTRNISSPKILDVGSGAGLPGVVLAIMNANYQVCCVDAVEKKTAFISAVKGRLCQGNLTSKHARIEKLEAAKADIVISRAFASISDFVEMAQLHVSVGGRLVAMKAKGVDDEIHEMMNRFSCWKVATIEKLKVPDSNVERCLVWLQKEE